MAHGDQRIRIVERNKPGIVSALNTGIEAANGDYIARMDADDVSMPERLQLQLAHLQQQSPNTIVGGVVDIVGESGAGTRYYQQWLNNLTTATAIERDIFIESPLPHPTWFASTGVFRRLRYRDCEWAEDYDFLLRAWYDGIPMIKPQPTILQWREHPHRLTHRDARYARTQFTNAKASMLSQTLCNNRNAIICGTGRNATRLHDALLNCNIKTSCFVDLDPVQQGRTRRHLPIIGYETLRRKYSNGDDNKPTERPLIISAITQRDAGKKLRLWLLGNGMTELLDFVIAG